MTVEDDANKLDTGVSSLGVGTNDVTFSFLTFGFPDIYSTYNTDSDPYKSSGFNLNSLTTPLTTSMQAAVVTALQEFSSVAGFQFDLVTQQANRNDFLNSQGAAVDAN